MCMSARGMGLYECIFKGVTVCSMTGLNEWEIDITHAYERDARE